MSTKLAQFKQLEHGYISIQAEIFEQVPGYIRITEYVEVDFPPRNDASVINDEISKLDEVIESIRSEALAKIESINTRKAELLALTNG